MKSFTEKQHDAIAEILTKLVETGIDDPDDLDKAIKEIEMVVLGA